MPCPGAVIPTGSLGLDAALGIGGIPRGCITEIFGPEGSGKTSLALHIIAEAQKGREWAAFIDAEHALDAVYARSLGVNMQTLLISQPDTGEQVFDMLEVLIRSGALAVIVVDSVAALVPKAERHGGMQGIPPGRQAQLVSQGLGRLTTIVGKSRTSLIFVNQLRQKVGVAFDHADTTAGGNALRCYTAIRLEVRCVEAVRSGEEVLGSRTRVRVLKNRLAPPFRQTGFDLLYGRGIWRPGELVDLAVRYGLIARHGPWLTYNGTQLGRQREDAKACLQTSPDLAVALERQVRQLLGLPLCVS